MAHPSTRRKLPLIDLTDNPDVVRDLNALGNALDNVAVLNYGSLATRPAAGQIQGDIYWATDDFTMGPNGTPYTWDGTAWRLWAHPNDPAAATAGARTLGTGAQQAAAGNDARLSDARTPLAHVATHRSGGTDELLHLSSNQLQVKDVGQTSQLRAGRVFTVADFNTLLGLNAPIALYNLADLTDATANGNTLTNKGPVTFGGTGIIGTNVVAIFPGGSAYSLYRADIGAGDPFRIKTGSWGCWYKTAKKPVQSTLMSKMSTTAGQNAFKLEINNGIVGASITTDGLIGSMAGPVGTVDTVDDRWHFAVATFDGTLLKIYLDGALEGVSQISGMIFGGSGPFNLGSQQTDAATVGGAPFVGRMDEAFVMVDVLSEEQIRLLYAAKLAHGLSVQPRVAAMQIRRRRRGAAFLPADFPANPRRLYNFTGGALTDAGLDNQVLANTGGALAVAGADGFQGGAFNFAVSTLPYMTATDTGLPALATTPRVMGCWFKTNTSALGVMMAYGSVGAGNGLALYISAAGNLEATDGTVTLASGRFVADGQWHFAVLVQDPNSTDALPWKLYLDGRLVSQAPSAITAIALIGAAGFRIARDRGANTNYFNGQIDGVFVMDSVPTPENLSALYAKGTQQMPISPKDAGAHIEAIDATNLYLICDTLDPQHLIDLEVAA